MADTFKTFKVTQPNLGGPLQEALVGAVQTSTPPYTPGAADAGKVVLLNASGQLDPSLGASSFPVSTPQLVVTGGSITVTGTGIIEATELATTGAPVVISGSAPTHAGQLLISQPGNATAMWADPFVQGVFIPGTNVNTGFSGGPIQPVLVGGSDYAGTPLLQNIRVDPSGNVYSNIQASGVALTATGSALNVNVTNASGSTVTGGQTAETTATWTPSTPINTVLALTVTGYGTVKVTLNQGATLSGGVIQFEASDTAGNVNWYSINAGEDNASSSTPASSSYALLPNTNQSFTIGSAAWVQVRVRLSTTITVGSVNVGIAAMAFSGGSGAGGGGGGGAQYTEGSVVPTATGTVALGKNYGTNLVSALQLDGSSNLDTNIQLAVFATTPGSAVPSRAVWLGASDSTNLQGLLVDSTANKNLRVAIFSGSQAISNTGSSLNVDITNTILSTQDQADVTAGTTTAPTKILIVGGKTADGSPAYDPIPLIAGGTAVSVQSTHDYTQGSTTSGQLGPLVQGAVSTSDPSYTTGQTDPMSLTLQGHLRTQDYAEANANGSTAVPNNAMFVGARGADGFLHGLSSSTNDGHLDVNASFSGSVTTSFIADRIQSGAITSTQTVVVSTQGASSLVFNITGTWTGTIQFQLQLGDNSWTTATSYPVDTGGPSVTQTTSNGQWQLPVGGWQSFRVIGNTVTSGSATANLEAGAGIFSSFVEQLTASTLNVNATQVTSPWVTSVSGTVAVSNTTQFYAQGSTTSGQIGPLMQGAVATNDPSYTSGQTDPMSLTTTGHLRTQDSATSATGVAVPSKAIFVGGVGTDGFLHGFSTDNTGKLNVNASFSGSVSTALPPDNSNTGVITSTQNVALIFNSTTLGSTAQGGGSLTFNVTGAWTGTLVFEGSTDGTNFYSVNAIPYPASTATVTSTTVNGQWLVATGGLNTFRVRGNTVATGTATVWIELGIGPNGLLVLQPTAANLNATVVQSTAANLNATSELTDGTHGIVAVKAASTPPTTTDIALVVALSPNSSQFATSTTATTLPGTNPQTIGTSSSAVVNANAARKEVTITNTGTTYIYIGLGQTPTNTSYHIALSKCTAANDATGGTWTSDMWKGAVNAISSGAGGTVNVVELT
jgi:hypothetical protein